MTNITEESYNPFNIHHRIGYPKFNSTGITFPWHHKANAAKTLWRMAKVLDVPFDYHSIHRAVSLTLDSSRYSFRLGGFCFDIPIGLQQAAIRCDIGDLAGVEIERDL